jgi:hypothetical protein
VNGDTAGDLDGAGWRIVVSGDGFVTDHRVRGVPVLPAVAYLDFVVRAAHAALGPAPVELRDVAVVAPLAISPGETRIVCVLLARGRGDRVWFQVVSEAPGRVVEHVSGSLRPADRETRPPRLDLASITARCATPLDVQRLYPASGGQAIEYGPCFRAVTWARTSGDEVLASVVLPESPRWRDLHVLHPAVVDGALHALAAVLESDSDGGLYLPFVFGRVQELAALPERVLVHGRRKDRGTGRGAELLCGDVRLYDADGRPCAALDDVTLKRVPAGRAIGEARAATREASQEEREP